MRGHRFHEKLINYLGPQREEKGIFVLLERNTETIVDVTDISKKK